jgi:hypothetical protein
MKPLKFQPLSAQEVNAIKALDAAGDYAVRAHVFGTVANVLARNEHHAVDWAVCELATQFFGGGKDFEQALGQLRLDEAIRSKLNDLHGSQNNAENLASLALGFEWGQLVARGKRVEPPAFHPSLMAKYSL